MLYISKVSKYVADIDQLDNMIPYESDIHYTEPLTKEQMDNFLKLENLKHKFDLDMNCCIIVKTIELDGNILFDENYPLEGYNDLDVKDSDVLSYYYDAYYPMAESIEEASEEFFNDCDDGINNTKTQFLYFDVVNDDNIKYHIVNKKFTTNSYKEAVDNVVPTIKSNITKSMPKGSINYKE